MSYTLSANVVPRIATNAEFIAYWQWLGNAMANAGFANTSDSGQINWATVTAPATTGTMQGYEIWKFNDALQNTAPVYIKIEYGSSASGNTIPGMRLWVGTGSTGTGNLTGFLMKDRGHAAGNSYTILESAGAFANNTHVHYFAGDGAAGWFNIAYSFRGTGATSFYKIGLFVERTVDANGVATGDGLFATYLHGGGTGLGEAVWSPVIGTRMHNGIAADGLGFLNPEKGGGTTGSNVAVYPQFLNAGGGPFLNPGYALFAYWNGEITSGSANTFSVYGSNHTYMPLGNTAAPGSAFSYRSNGQLALMMRYE